jgi:hypothetical protein
MTFHKLRYGGMKITIKQLLPVGAFLLACSVYGPAPNEINIDVNKQGV